MRSSVTNLSSKMQRNEDRALLLHLATISDIPISVMEWLIDKEIIESIQDVHLITVDDLSTYQGEYQSSDPTSHLTSPWTQIVSHKIGSLIQWLISYRRTFGGYPHPCILSKENFKTPPEVLHFLWNKKGISPATVISNCVSGSQSTNQRHSSYNILAYPKFSGHAKDWIKFERDFRAVATAQGFGYILTREVHLSTTTFNQSNYALDSAFIYNVLQSCWSDSTNSYLVKQHSYSKDGHQLYLDAQLHFRVQQTATPVKQPAPSCSLSSSYDRQQAIKSRIAQLRLRNANKSNSIVHGTSVTTFKANTELSPVSPLVLWRYPVLFTLVLTFLLRMTLHCTALMLLGPLWSHLSCTI